MFINFKFQSYILGYSKAVSAGVGNCANQQFSYQNNQYTIQLITESCCMCTIFQNRLSSDQDSCLKVCYCQLLVSFVGRHEETPKYEGGEGLDNIPFNARETHEKVMRRKVQTVVVYTAVEVCKQTVCSWPDFTLSADYSFQ